MLVLTLDNLSLIYDALYQAAIDQGWACWGGDQRMAQGVSQLQRILSPHFVPKSGTALELGCGEGHLCRLLAAHGYRVTGVDISSVAIAWAKQKQPPSDTIHYLQSDIAATDFTLDARFDLIIDGNCLHCVIGDRRAVFLKNIHTLLHEHGIVFISSLCSQDADNHILLHQNMPYRFIPTAHYIIVEMIAAGFSVLEHHVHRRDQINHINLFLKKTAAHHH